MYKHRIKLMTDSGSDITEEYEREYDIQVVPFRVTVGTKEYVSRRDFDNEQFYRIMDDYRGIPVTAQITPFEFEEYFELHYRAGYTDVINLSINSAGSGTHSNSILAEDNFFSSHPEARGRFHIYNIDSTTYTGCYGYAVVEAAKMIRSGAAAEEIVAFIRDWCATVTAYFAPYTLKYAGRSGRIPVAAQFLGDALGIKPLMEIHDHEITVIGKVRNEKNIVPNLARMAVRDIEEGSPYCVICGNDASLGRDLEQALYTHLAYPPADRYQLGAVIAANAGPRTVGVLFRKKKNT